MKKKILSIILAVLLLFSVSTSLFIGFAEHSHVYTAIVVNPTCTEDGYTLHTCLGCDNFYKDATVVKLNHNFVDYAKVNPTCTSDGYTQQICLNCATVKQSSVLNATNHTSPVWVTVKAATCIATGEKIGYCKTCGEKISTQVINKEEHNFVTRIASEPTTEHNGITETVCTACGYVKTTSTISLHTHKFGHQEILTESTCTQKGVMGTFCSVCNACYSTSEIQASGHSKNAVTVVSVQATCTTAGESVTYCDKCGEKTDSSVIKALNHTEGVWQINSQPTCTAKGEEICTCGRCGQVYQSREVKELNHIPGDWQTTVPPTCTTKGEKVRTCTRCNVVVETAKIDALGHDDGVWTSSTATCLYDGESVCHCTRCGKAINSKVITATGHDKGVWKVDFEATANHDGQMTRYCSKCNTALESKSFSLHTHTFGFESVDTEPTCTTEGLMGKFCSKCGVEYESYTLKALGHLYGEISTNNNGTHSRSCDRCHDLQINNCNYVDKIEEPTCTTGGRTVHTCADCGYVFFDQFTFPLGHGFGKWAESDNDGFHCRRCKTCNEMEFEAHIWSDWEENDTRTCCQKFTKNIPLIRHCEVCDAVENSELLHTSILAKIFYPLCTWVRNILHKTQFIASIDWLFPWLNIYPTPVVE